MLEITNLVTPSAEDFEVTIKGMRLPFKSGDKSDSQHCTGKTIKEDTFKYCLVYEKTCTPECDCFILGENDEKLLLNLSKAGDPSHRKVLRQLPVKCFITAPLYWWKQMDQYKIGTVTNSESTMHVLTKYPFKIEDFSLDYFNSIKYSMRFGDINPKIHLTTTILLLNQLREIYLEESDEEIREVIWNQINELLPQSYKQTRCWSGNYENLLTIINQRSGHKLVEWKEFIDYMLDHVPYLKEINEAVND